MQGVVVLGLGLLAVAMAQVDRVPITVNDEDVPLYETQTKLRHDLLDNYEKTSVPVLKLNEPVEVKFGAAVLKTEIDEEEAVVRTDMFTIMTFKDTRLVWDAEEYNGIEQIAIPSSDVWLPDVTHYQDTRKFSGADQLSATFGNNVNVIVYKDGTVIYVPSITVETPCKLDYTQWPLDTQFCNTKFGSWVHDNKIIKLEIMDTSEVTEMVKATPSLTWTLQDLRFKKTDFAFKDLKYDVIEIKFEFHRKADKFCTTLFGPIFVSILISLLGFLEPSGKPIKHLIYIFNIFFLVGVSFFHYSSNLEGKPKIFCFIFGFVLVQFLVVFGDHLTKVGNCFGKKIIKVVKKFQKVDKYSKHNEDPLSDPVIVRDITEEGKPLYNFALQGLLLGVHVTLIGALYMAYWPSKFMVIHDPEVIV